MKIFLMLSDGGNRWVSMCSLTTHFGLASLYFIIPVKDIVLSSSSLVRGHFQGWGPQSILEFFPEHGIQDIIFRVIQRLLHSLSTFSQKIKFYKIVAIKTFDKIQYPLMTLKTNTTRKSVLQVNFLNLIKDVWIISHFMVKYWEFFLET